MGVSKTRPGRSTLTAEKMAAGLRGTLSHLAKTDLVEALGYANVKWWGTPSASDGDATGYIQEASDWTNALLVTTSRFGLGIPELRFPGTTYKVTDTIYKGYSPWVGSGPRLSQFIWDNVAQSGLKDMVVQNVLANGNNSATGIRGMSFWAKDEATNKPRTILVLGKNASGYGADVHYRLSEVGFRGCSDYCIDVTNFVNLHIEHPRFDSWSKFAVRLAVDTPQNQSSFTLTNWTCDHMAGSGGEGFLLLENVGNVASAGIVTLQGARGETNAALTGRKGFVVSKSETSDWMHIVLRDLTIQDVGNVTSGDCLIYHDSVTAGSDLVTIDNLVGGTLTSIFGGNWPTDFPAPTMFPAIHFSSLMVSRQAAAGFLRNSAGTHRGWNIYTRDVAGAAGLRVWRKDEANPRIEMGADGTILTGTGAATPTKVVSARKTGWTAATGTAQRSGFATYTAPTISATPTQAEVQALAAALQDASRTLKALVDDLHATAGHGLIGT